MIGNPHIPPLARALGYAGLLPFLAGTGALFSPDPTVSGPALYALTVYAAVILSFMGAVHWGLAMANAQAPARAQLGASVLPALLGWGALVALPPREALVVFGGLFAALLVADWLAVRAALAPRWYLSLRLPLTVVVCACLWTAAWSLGR